MTNSEIKILIADDDEEILELLTIVLKSEGFQVFTAMNGRVAVSSAKKNNPHLILLDVMMPEMDGPTTLSHLRNIAATAQVPVIFMTAKVQQNEVAHYLSLGAIGVVSKPFDPMTLVKQINEILAPLGSGIGA